MKYVHTNIACKDWKSLCNFYVKTFQCKIKPPIRKQSGDWLARGTGLKNANLEGVHLMLPGYGETGPTLEIYQYGTMENTPEASPNTRGFGHIAFEVECVEDVLERLIANGGQACGETTQRKVEGVGEITFVYARDPEGNLIELQHWDLQS